MCRVGERRQRPTEAAFLVVGDDLVDETAYRIGIARRVERTPADQLAYFAFDSRQRTRHRIPVLPVRRPTLTNATAPRQRVVSIVVDTSWAPRRDGPEHLPHRIARRTGDRDVES